jgi:hypothetical protein
MKIIAISGWKRSGKDTAANLLISNGYERVAFADVLKDMVAQEYNIPREHCDDPNFKEAPILHLPVTPKDDFSLMLCNFMYREFRSSDGHMAMEPYVDDSGAFLGVMGRNVAQLYWTPRALCILKGSVNRAVTSTFWTERAISQIRTKAAKNFNEGITNGGFVISDLRYQSEIDQLKAAFGKNLVTVRVERFETSASTDPSERDLDKAKFDVILDNKGTIQDFELKVKELLNGN